MAVISQSNGGVFAGWAVAFLLGAALALLGMATHSSQPQPCAPTTHNSSTR